VPIKAAARRRAFVIGEPPEETKPADRARHLAGLDCPPLPDRGTVIGAVPVALGDNGITAASGISTLDPAPDLFRACDRSVSRTARGS
jgi:hypothetical protein